MLRRLIAIGLVALLVLATVGASAPIVVPPASETLLEGHTVFGVIDIVSRTETREARFAAAVAILVREVNKIERAERFPGVAWFNDQYLVNPTSSYEDQAARGPFDLRRPLGPYSFRYPCGGAVMAVNAGDPDPRVALARADAKNLPLPPPLSTDVALFAPEGADTYDEDYAWLDAEVDAAGPSVDLHSDTVVGASLLRRFDYNESYLITDPNDHTWIIDKYDFYTRDGVSAGARALLPSAVPLWVVNMYGSAVFLPDDGTSSCVPLADVSSAAAFGFSGCANPNDSRYADGMPLDCAQSRAHESTCGTGVPNGYDSGGGEPGFLGGEPYADSPCAGYREPSRNGYCYGGQAPDPAGGGCADRDASPMRTYNALLYFRLSDLRIAGDPRDHTDPVTSTDTNGCQS
ncbi:MAG TPA: hypothetical protein VM582_01190, partial [Candidatus Thermoplasmatota archaeon]|nr:hypothetical protein [Candidatus Thermoplasmatota archaeon]